MYHKKILSTSAARPDEGGFLEWLKKSEVQNMHDTLKFETFVDAYENIFEEYLSSVVAKLPGENEDYRAVQNEIESLYESYPGVLGIFDAEKAAALSEQECAALVKVLLLKNRLTELEMQSVYFRGCCDGVGYLRKAGYGVRFADCAASNHL